MRTSGRRTAMFDIALSNDDDDLARQNAMDLLSDAGFSFFGFATGHWVFFISHTTSYQIVPLKQ